jgi:hypothetical protein
MLFSIFKKVTGFDPAAILILIFVAVFAAILIPNADRVLGFFGYETRAVLKEKLNTANNNVEVASNVNKASHIAVTVLEKNVKTVEKVLTKKATEEAATLKFTTEIKVKKDKDIEKIQTDPSKSSVEKEKQISEVQITSLWDSYCSFNPDQQCKTPANG